jgi:hypothetical protein
MPQTRYGIHNQAAEWTYISGIAYSDPFNDVELDVMFEDAFENVWKVPAFWSGDNEWRIRFSPPNPGIYEYLTICSDENNCDLHGRKGILNVLPYEGNNELMKHGSIKVSRNRKYFEHYDGTPFFWLGDTWWMALCSRLQWPDEFQMLTTDRKNKGLA